MAGFIEINCFIVWCWSIHELLQPLVGDCKRHYGELPKAVFLCEEGMFPIVIRVWYEIGDWSDE